MSRGEKKAEKITEINDLIVITHSQDHCSIASETMRARGEYNLACEQLIAILLGYADPVEL